MTKNSNREDKAIFLSILAAALFLSGCAAGDVRFTAETPAGFFHGLWHGIIVVVAFVISLFSDTVCIYEANNNGAWYDFGYVLGIICIGGGSLRAHCQRKAHRRSDAEWEEIGKKVERKVMRALSSLTDEAADRGAKGISDEPAPNAAPGEAARKDAEWEEIGKKIEEKIKRKIRKWAEEE